MRDRYCFAVTVVREIIVIMGRFNPYHPESHWIDMARVLRDRVERISTTTTTTKIYTLPTDLDKPEVKAMIREMSASFREAADSIDKMGKP